MSAAALDPAEAMSTAISDAYDQLRQLVEKFAGRRDDPQLLEEVGTLRRRALGRYNRAKKKAEPAAEKAEPRAAAPAPAATASKPAAELAPAAPKVTVPAAKPATQSADRVSVRLPEPAKPAAEPRPVAPSRSSAAGAPAGPGRHRKPRAPRWIPALAAVLLVFGVALAELAGQPLWAVGSTVLAAPLVAVAVRRSRTAGRAR